MKRNSLKGRFPFRLGATSYVQPADMVTNVAFLAPYVDDVELLLFESDEMSALPSTADVAALLSLAQEADLSYTVHLPLDIAPGSSDAACRRRSVGKIVRAMQSVAALEPFAYILHLPWPTGQAVQKDTRHIWQRALACTLQEMSAQGIAMQKLCVETLDYPLAWLDGLFDAFDVSVCLDVGHLLLAGRDVSDTMEHYWNRLRVVHLHGVVGGKDHHSVSCLDPQRLSAWLACFNNDIQRERVVTLELFEQQRWEDSMGAMEKQL